MDHWLELLGRLQTLKQSISKQIVHSFFDLLL